MPKFHKSNLMKKEQPNRKFWMKNSQTLSDKTFTKTYSTSTNIARIAQSLPKWNYWFPTESHSKDPIHHRPIGMFPRKEFKLLSLPKVKLPLRRRMSSLHQRYLSRLRSKQQRSLSDASWNHSWPTYFSCRLTWISTEDTAKMSRREFCGLKFWQKKKFNRSRTKLSKIAKIEKLLRQKLQKKPNNWPRNQTVASLVKNQLRQDLLLVPRLLRANRL